MMAHPEASIEITVTSRGGGPPLLHQRFETTRELAVEFAEKMSAMVAKLPGKHQVTQKLVKDGVTVVEIELNKDHPPPAVTQPTFQELFSPFTGEPNDHEETQK